MAAMSELGERSARGQRDWACRDQPVAQGCRQDPQEPVRIVQGTLRDAEFPDTAYGRLGVVCAKRAVTQAWRSKREPAASLVDPEAQAGVAGLGHDVGIAVVIDIRDD